MRLELGINEMFVDSKNDKPTFLTCTPCSNSTSPMARFSSNTFSLSSTRTADLAQFTLFVLLLCCCLPLFYARPQNARSSNLEAENTTPSRRTTRSTNGYKNVAYFANWYALNSHFTSRSYLIIMQQGHLRPQLPTPKPYRRRPDPRSLCLRQHPSRDR